MSRLLNDLRPEFRAKAVELIALLVEARVMVVITSTGRTAEEQEAAVRAGTSKVKHSKHQDGFAMDLALIGAYFDHGIRKVNYDLQDPQWRIIGRFAKQLGLIWGGDFRPLNDEGLGWDPGHVEMPDPVAPITRV